MTLTRGRLPTTKIEVVEVRPLTRDDLQAIREKRETSVVQRLRDPHHRAARLIASGVRLQDVASICGYSMQRIYTLNLDPAFKNLVEDYRKDVREGFRDAESEHHAAVLEVQRKALRHLSEAYDKADEEGEIIPVRTSLSVFSDLSDRVGIQKKSTVTNVNVDFAKQLENAIARSRPALAPPVDITPTSSPTPSPLNSASPEPIRRRA